MLYQAVKRPMRKPNQQCVLDQLKQLLVEGQPVWPAI